MRTGAQILALALLPGATWAQGSMLDLGKSVLQQQMGQGGGGATSSTTRGGALSNTDIASGLKDALRQGAAAVTSRLGRADGFNADPNVHIPLPASLQRIQSGLKLAGIFSYLADEEAAIRSDPAKRTTDLLRKVFAN